MITIALWARFHVKPCCVRNLNSEADLGLLQHPRWISLWYYVAAVIDPPLEFVLILENVVGKRHLVFYERHVRKRCSSKVSNLKNSMNGVKVLNHSYPLRWNSRQTLNQIGVFSQNSMKVEFIKWIMCSDPKLVSGQPREVRKKTFKSHK